MATRHILATELRKCKFEQHLCCAPMRSSHLAVPFMVVCTCTLCYCVLCLVCSVFVGVIEQLFDEDVLIGSGWTARETIRCVCV